MVVERIEDKLILGKFLAKLNSMTVGEDFMAEDIDFSVFWLDKEKGVFYERGDRKLLRPLNVFLWGKDRKESSYTISSKSRSYDISSLHGNWRIDGGYVALDNLHGSHFVTSPLSRFRSGSEARFYTYRVESALSFKSGTGKNL